mmetsp:Transcript_46991/g.75524  ORF Transcript_46991/g.75524 Transcript_46991/m.75524 type:complete len:487 (+) Transcript_46991:57-1517(+)
MGNALEGFKGKKLKEATRISAEAGPVSNWDVATIKAAFKKAEKAQTGLGYSLSRLLMKEVLELSEESYDMLVKCWRKNGVVQPTPTEFRSIMIAALAVCKGTVYTKIHAMFHIMDEDDDKILTRKQAKELGHLGIKGVARFTSFPISTKEMHSYLDYYMYHYVPKGKDGVQLKHMLGFACHPETLPVLRAMSTSDGLNRQQRQLVLDLNAEMETKRLFVQRVYNTESKVRGGSDIYDKTEHKYSRVRVEKLKLLFDTLDTAEIGKVPFKLLYAHVHHQEHDELPMDRPVSFDSFLSKVFPYSVKEERDVMHSWVYYTPVNKQLVQKLQRIFNHLNVAFSGKVCLGRVYRILRKSKELLQYIGDISRLNLSEEEETTAVSFIDMLEHLFKYTHHHQLAQIISWANIAPTPMLDEQRLRDIQEMFKKCDEDGGGTISLEEFKESLVNSGIARSEAIRRFKDINSDGDAEITSLAFVKFYSESLSLNVG